MITYQLTTGFKKFYSFYYNLFTNLSLNSESITTTIQAKGGGKAHAHCAQDIQGYRYTLRICNTYGFSTERRVTLQRLNVSLSLLCFYFINTLLHFPLLWNLWLNAFIAWTAITLNLIITVTSPTEFLSSLNVKVIYLLRMLITQIHNILLVSSVVLFVKQHNYVTWATTMQKLQWNFSLHLRQTVLLVSP
jgi:hypothetical protein